MAKIITCSNCGAAYDEAVIVKLAEGKKRDKITSDGVHANPDAADQRSVTCKVCGSLVYRTVDGERVHASRPEYLDSLTAEERTAALTTEEAKAEE